MDVLQALTLILALIVVVLIVQIRTLAGRVGRLEQSGWGGAQPNQLASSSETAPTAASTPEQPSEAVLDFVGAGKKIDAIKQYRIETGAGLREAKDAVEAFERGAR